MSLSECHSAQPPPSLQLLNIPLPPCSPPRPFSYTFTSPLLARPFFFPFSSFLHLPPQRFALVIAETGFSRAVNSILMVIPCRKQTPLKADYFAAVTKVCLCHKHQPFPIVHWGCCSLAAERGRNTPWTGQRSTTGLWEEEGVTGARVTPLVWIFVTVGSKNQPIMAAKVWFTQLLLSVVSAPS